MFSLFREHRLLRFADERDKGQAEAAPQYTEGASARTDVLRNNPGAAPQVADGYRADAKALASKQRDQEKTHADNIAGVQQQLAAEGSASGAGGTAAV